MNHPISRRHFATLLLPACVLATSAFAQTKPDKPRGGGNKPDKNSEDPRSGREKPNSTFHTEVPAHSHDLILARPTASSVLASLLAYAPLEAFIEYGPASGQYDQKTPVATLRPGEPHEFLLGHLAENAPAFYRLQHRKPGAARFSPDPERRIQTARRPGETFTFSIQADSHLDTPTSLDVYRQNLANIERTQPDFLIDLGDTFMTDKRPRYQDAAAQYLAQRYHFGSVAHSAPLFLALGNHDGETLGKRRDGAEDEMAVWSNGMRKRFFPNPQPDAFYSGNMHPHPRAGLLQNYYAWHWGDALIVVLDPFWFSTPTRGRSETVDNWGRTLGVEQYRWLARTLEASPAKFKFVFIHHLTGGETREGRGGAEAARFFEWGGCDLDGRDRFAEKRPGWPEPVHNLLVRHRVSAVFHGHDHMYARQERDGIVYQLVPQPSHARGSTRSAEEYGYRSGQILPSSGHLRVSVTSASATIDYLSSSPGAEVIASYQIAALA